MRGLIATFAFLALFPAAAGACDIVPPLGIAIDSGLESSTLAASDRQKAQDGKARMLVLAERGDLDGAREAEAEVMKLLGFTKAWLACGRGTFLWMKDPSTPTN